MATRRPTSADKPIVLLVEDDEALRAALGFALEIDGFEVWGFATAEALLDVSALPEDALLLLDEKLPGMSGLDLLENLRKRRPAMPVILITTSTPPVRARALALRAPIIEKPLLNDDLLRKVQTIAARVRPGAGTREPD